MKYPYLLFHGCLTVVLATSLPVFLPPTDMSEVKAHKEPPKEIISFRLSLGSEGSGRHLDLRITDPKLIRELLEEPLRQATINPKPARYVPFASLTIEYKGGSTDGMVLFLPWGHYKYNEKYLTTDFSTLRKELKTQIDETGRLFR